MFFYSYCKIKTRNEGNNMKVKAEQIFEKGLSLKQDKANTLVKFLEAYIVKAKENDLLPSKQEVSSFLNVSMGTVQNAYRILEDKGLVKSKQRIGTVITSSDVKKQVSKRDCCVNLIKKYMLANNIKDTSELPSVRKMAKEIHMSCNTVNSAIKSIQNGNSENISKEKSLIGQIEKDIENYISENCKIGDNIPTLNEFSKILNVSIKTVHDAVKQLSAKRILTPHRGRYGTTVINMPNSIKMKKEDSIFAPAKDASFYFYEKVQNHIKKFIINNCEVGSKLPSIREMALEMNVNSNTIRRALKNLEEDEYITFERGRYGGTFVTEIPDEISYKWLALNPKFVAVYN